MPKERIKQILITDNIVDSINENLNEQLNIIPEIKYMIGFEHNHPHHHLDVWNHTLLALSFSPKNFKIRLVLLLHDIGKPHSYQDLEIRHFKGHAQKSCEIANNILARLKFIQSEIDEICYLIKSHDNMIKQQLIDNNRTLAQTLFEIQFCDAMAHNPGKLEKRTKYLLSINEKINTDLEREKMRLLITDMFNSRSGTKMIKTKKQ